MQLIKLRLLIQGRFWSRYPYCAVLITSLLLCCPHRVVLAASPLLLSLLRHLYCCPFYCLHCLILLILPILLIIWRALLLLPAERCTEGVVAMHQAAVLRARLLLFLKSELVRPLAVKGSAWRRLQSSWARVSHLLRVWLQPRLRTRAPTSRWAVSRAGR